MRPDIWCDAQHFYNVPYAFKNSVLQIWEVLFIIYIRSMLFPVRFKFPLSLVIF